MLTRKDYKAIAFIITETNGQVFKKMIHWIDGRGDVPARYISQSDLIARLVDYMAQDNPNFDRQRFLDACYGGK